MSYIAALRDDAGLDTGTPRRMPSAPTRRTSHGDAQHGIPPGIVGTSRRIRGALQQIEKLAQERRPRC